MNLATKILSVFILILGLALINDAARADSVVTPYFSLGAYKRDCNLTDPMICNNNKMGSDTPGTIDLGLRVKPDGRKFYYLFAHEVDVGWHHQSYVNRGWLIPGVLDYGGQESQIDMYGVRFTWLMKPLTFNLPF